MIKQRYDWVSALAEELCAQRAADRVGSIVDVLVDAPGEDLDPEADAEVEGRAAHQAPEVDGSTTLVSGGAIEPGSLRPGDLVRAKVVGNIGVDLTAVPIEIISAAKRP
jgi:tRNA A37 methylthiotransferase MiaB